ncbi:MAG: hypothetical protein R3F11_20255 [Verrucomicrobiales bacterium]
MRRAASGIYALMDYVNFKGEGTNPSGATRVRAGACPVLGDMRPTPKGARPPSEFAAAADRMLTRRVQAAPKMSPAGSCGCSTGSRPTRRSCPQRRIACPRSFHDRDPDD